LKCASTSISEFKTLVSKFYDVTDITHPLKTDILKTDISNPLLFDFEYANRNTMSMQQAETSRLEG